MLKVWPCMQELFATDQKQAPVTFINKLECIALHIFTQITSSMQVLITQTGCIDAKC